MQVRQDNAGGTTVPVAAEKSSHLLYQVGTVVAILVFLISFWA